MEYILPFIIGVSVAIILFFLFKKQLLSNTQESSDASYKVLEMQLKALLPEVLQQNYEILVNMANEKLGSEKKEIKTDLDNKRSEIQRIVKDIETELKKNQEELIKSDKERIGSYMALKQQLDANQKITEQLRVTTESLNKVLSDNQLRGQFGEKVAEDLLRMSGFVKGIDYEFNKQQSGSETRPDFSVFLPDGTRINVDAKFPYANLQRMSATDDAGQKQKYLKDFERDVKEKVKQVTTRDYINGDDNTVDFVILFIPNEMIFSFIYENLQEVWEDAMSKKVILAGPFSFTAILRMVRQAYENFRYQSNIKEIIQHIKSFEKEFGLFFEEFQKIGTRINQLDKQYQTVNTTRVNQLVRRMDKVRLESDDGEQRKLLD